MDTYKSNDDASDPLTAMPEQMRSLAMEAIQSRVSKLFTYDICSLSVRFYSMPGVIPVSVVSMSNGLLTCQHTVPAARYNWTLNGKPVVLPADVAYQVNYSAPLTSSTPSLWLNVTATATDGSQQQRTYAGYIQQEVPSISVYVSRILE